MFFIGVVIETSENIYHNTQNGESLGKIAWDATVDTTILGTNAMLATATGMAIGTAIPIPIVGTFIGGVGGFIVGLTLDYLSEDTVSQLKSMVD